MILIIGVSTIAATSTNQSTALTSTSESTTNALTTTNTTIQEPIATSDSSSDNNIETTNNQEVTTEDNILTTDSSTTKDTTSNTKTKSDTTKDNSEIQTNNVNTLNNNNSNSQIKYKDTTSNEINVTTINTNIPKTLSKEVVKTTVTPTGSIIYVNTTGGGNGDTESSACGLSDAVNYANSNNAGTGTWTIKLASGTYNFTSVLTISKNITFNGSTLSTGTIFNGQNKTSMFSLSKDYVVLTLNNINFTNGFTSSSSNGGTISVTHGTLIVNNCNFTNSIAYNQGGAIRFNPSNDYTYLNITNCNFINNSAVDKTGIHTAFGGALRLYSQSLRSTTIYITNSTFKDNQAQGGTVENRGGAINLNFIACVIDNCTFSNNTAGEAGGAIRTNYNLTVLNSVFDSNKLLGVGSKGEFAGTAISNNNGQNGLAAISSLVLLNNCTFKNHSASYNGTVSTTGVCNITVINCDFENNSAMNGSSIFNSGGLITINNSSVFKNNNATNGGAIFNTGGNIDITDTYFENNTAKFDGGVIYNIGGSININDLTIFLDNGVKSNTFYNLFTRGGVLYNTGGNVTINNSLFDSNFAADGGVIYNQGILNTTNNLFINNTAILNGGVIFNNGNLNSSSNLFKLNNATNGGVVYVSNDENQYTTFTGDIFTNNTAMDAAVIYLVSNNANITSCIFENNTATSAVSAIYIVNIGNSMDTPNGVVNIENTTISHNKVLNKDVLTNGNGAVLIEYNDVTIINSNITYNEGVCGGGVSVLYANVNVTNTLFENNTAMSGGALNDFLGNVIVSYSTFINNTAYGNNDTLSNHGIGGAMINSGTILVQGCNFDGNNASRNGGAIYNNGTFYDGVIDASNKYLNNVAGLNGGALYVITSTISQNTYFANNKATNGGAVYALANNDVTVYNLTFSNNTATGNGGGLYLSAPAGTIASNGYLMLDHLLFVNNSASNGGAIYNVFGSGTLKNTTFINNTASNNGGVIANSYKLVIKNSTIMNSKAGNYGGVVYNNVTGTINITNVTVKNNTANVGGVIYNLNNIAVTNCTILNNTATNGAVSYNKNNLNISSSDIEDNLATNSNGFVIYNTQSTTLEVQNNLFKNNTDNVRDMLMYNEADVSSTVNNNKYIDNMLNDTIVPINDITIGKNFKGSVQIDLRDIYNDLVRNGTMTLHIYNSTDTVGTTLTATVVDGVATFNASTLNYGVDTVDVTYTTLSKHYQSAKTSFNLNVSEDVDKQHTNITIAHIDDIYVNETATITVHVTNTTGATVTVGQVNITIDGVTHTLNLDSNGNASFVYKPTSAGIKTVTAIYLGNTTYYPSLKNSTTFNVNKIATYISINPIQSINYGQSTNITVAVKINDINGNHVPYGNVSLIIDGEPYNLEISNGIATLNYTPTKAGNIEVYEQYQNNAIYKDSNVANSTILVNKLNVTITSHNVTGIATDNVTITVNVTDENGNPINEGIVKIYNGDQLIGVIELNENGTGNITKQFLEGNYTFTLNYTGSNNYNNATDTINVTIYKLNTTITIDTIKNIIINQTTTINATLIDENGVVLSNQNVTLIINGNEYNLTTDSNGKISQEFKSTITTNVNVTVYYNGTDKYVNSTNKTQFTVNKLQTTIVVNPINGTVYNNTILQANITDQNGNPVNGGRVVFKINGETIKDTNGNPIYASVINGTAKLEYNIPVSWAKDNLTIQAVYGGTSNIYYGSRSLNNTVDVSKRTAFITVITTKPIAQADNIVQYLAYVIDSNNTVLNSGVVVFKFQGHTITDLNGTTIKVNVTDGVAILNYTIPDGISAHNYTITAVYSNKAYYRAENTTTQLIKKIGTVIKINPVTTTNKNNITITGTIKDLNGHMVIGNSKVSIKINGKTVASNVTVSNGKINITIPNSYKQSSYTITAVTGERLGYLSSRSNSTQLLIKNTKTKIVSYGIVKV